MPEPISTTITTALIGWLTKTVATESWKVISGWLKPDQLIKSINKTLCEDDVAKAITPTPFLVKAHFTKQVASETLKLAVAQDMPKLGKLLLQEQVIGLPMSPDSRNESYDRVWEIVAEAVLDATFKAVQEDEKLFRAFIVESHQLEQRDHATLNSRFAALHGDVIEEIGQVRCQLSSVDDKLQAMNQSHVRLGDNTVAHSMNAMGSRIDELSEALRSELDEKAQRLWKETIDDAQVHNFDGAREKAGTLKDWLVQKEDHLSVETRGRTWLVLGQIALVVALSENGVTPDLRVAKERLELAKKAFGNSPADEHVDRVNSLWAKLLSAEYDDDGALKILGDSESPICISTKLQIYIATSKHQEAADLVRDSAPHAAWCKEAVLAFASAGETFLAAKFFDWSTQNNNHHDHRLVVFGFAQGSLSRVVGRGPAIPSRLTASEAELAQLTIASKHLDSIVSDVKNRGRIENPLEADAIALAYVCARVVGESDFVTKIEPLRDFRPAHVEVGAAMLRGDLPADGEFAKRLLSDHPLSVQTRRVALLVDLKSGSDAVQICDASLKLLADAKTDSEIDEAANLLLQLATISEVSLHERVEKALAAKLGQDSPISRIVAAHRLSGTDHEAFAKAVDQLANIDHPVVPQLRSQRFLNEKRYTEAADLMIENGTRMAETETLNHAAYLCLRRHPLRLGVAIDVLQSVIQLDSMDLQANQLLSEAFVKVQKFDEAAKHFEVLAAIDSSDTQYRFNQATCLMRANRPEEAIKILDELCKQPAAPVDPYVILAELKCDLGRPKEAFKSLQQERKRFWDEPAFVACYLNVCHAAGQERMAHEAFEQMWSMREVGTIPPEALQQQSVADFVEFSKRETEKRRYLVEQTQIGKLPWLFIDRLLGNVPYWAWMVRTQEMDWFFDDAANRGSFAIYATNSFLAVTKNAERRLVEIASSLRGHAAVVDYTALMTLHRLRILDEAIAYFGNVKIPSSYLASIIPDAGKLSQHQASRRNQLESIVKELNAGKIIASVQEATDNLVVIDEYAVDDDMCYVLQDLLNLLLDAGEISGDEHRIALDVAHKPAQSPESLSVLRKTDQLRFGLATLRTLTGLGFLDRLIRVAESTQLSEADIQRARKELDSYAVVDEVRQWHDDLWTQLQSNSNVDASIVLLTNFGNERDDNAKLTDEHESDTDYVEFNQDPSIDASLLATQEDLPLLVDDRVSQNHVGMVRNRPDAGFGTEQLLLAMWREGMLDINVVASSFVKLMRWRYRFLVCPAEILTSIAKSLPANDISVVARYVHDCMRDHGLFGGIENTSQPAILAMSFHQSWVKELAAMVVAIWFDADFEAGRKLELLHFIANRMLPTIPDSLGALSARLEGQTPYLLFNHVMHLSIDHRDHAETHRLLRSLASAIGFDEDEFMRLVFEIVDVNVRI